MKLNRLSHDPGMLIEFFEEGLTTLGAVCERSWHDRLELVAEGRAASLWNAAGDFLEKQLRFCGHVETSDCNTLKFLRGFESSPPQPLSPAGG